MRLLADENIPPETADFLRQLGHSVQEVSKLPLKSLPDPEIVRYAEQEGYVILTFDLGFGQTYYFDPTRRHGTIVVRVEPQVPELVHPLLERFHREVLPDLADADQALIVLSPGRCRVRRRRA